MVAEVAQKITGEQFFITQATSGMQSQDGTKGGGIMDPAFWVEVPVGQEWLFLPEHIFSAYLLRLSSPVSQALSDDGGTFTEETEEANTAGTDELTLLPATEVADDAYYFGHYAPFSCLRLKYSTAGVGTAIVWEYYNGTAWVAVAGLTDGTSGLTAAAGTHNVVFTPPGDWAQVVVDGRTAYWLRIRCSVASFTTTPVGDQAWIGGALELNNWDLVRIEVRNPDGWRTQAILETRYEQVKEFEDVDKKYALNISDPVRARGGDWVYILINCKGGLVDVSGCYFVLECIRARPSIYAKS